MIKAREVNRWVVGSLTQEQILSYYLNIEVKLGVLYKNPLRDDKTPSASFYYSDNGILFFHDFATGTHYSWANVVKLKYKLDYKDALQRIRKDHDRIAAKVVEVRPAEDVTIEIVRTLEYHPYFEKLGISKATLELFGVIPVKTVYRNGELHWRATRDNPIFAYTFPSGRVKLYRPLSPDKKKKWYGNADLEDVGGYNTINKKGKLLIITSSTKDCMTLREFGFPAICFNSETIVGKDGCYEYVDEVIKAVKYRFEHVVTMFDNDEAGRKQSERLRALYRISPIYSVGGKDITDSVKNKGKRFTLKRLKRALSKNFKTTIITPF